MSGERVEIELGGDGYSTLAEALAADFDEDPEEIVRESEAFEMSDPAESDIVEKD